MLLIGLFYIFVGEVYSDVSAFGGYAYPQPLPPFQFDELSTPVNTYLPPNTPIPPIQSDEIIPPSDPSPTYLPPVLYPPLGTAPPGIFNDDTPVYGPPPQVQVRILNMSCELDSKFQSLIRISGRNANLPPLVPEDGLDNCVTRGPVQNIFLMDMQGAKKMSDCGVSRCVTGNARTNMCVTLRMPTVRNLKLPEDGLINLQCNPQENVASHTKHIRLGSGIVSSNSRGRSSPSNTILATGGNQRNFDTKINLFRKSPGSDNFDQIIQPGTTVVMGEELMLRAAVQEGDGWQFSRLGPVVVRSASNQKSINLLDDNGCLSPGIRNICPNQPRQLGSLVSILPFRAFLFQGVSRDDVMLLSVRMMGCIRQQDCLQNFCGELIKPGLRSKRGLNKNATEEELANWQSEIQFRVSSEPGKPQNQRGNEISNEFVVLGVMFGLLIMGAVILIVIKKIIY